MPVRILYPFAGDTVGGSHISTFGIIRGLDSGRYEAIAVLHHEDGLLQTWCESQRQAFETLPDVICPSGLADFISHPVRSVKSIMRARRFLQERSIDIVHCDDGPLRHIWLYAARLAGVPYVHVQRTLTNVNFEKRITYRLASAVVSNSLATQKTLPFLPSSIPQAVSYPVVQFHYDMENRQANRAACLSLLNMDEGLDCALVGFVANLHRRKRPELFVEMAALIKAQSDKPVKFLMAGKFYAGMEEALRALVRSRGLEDDLVFSGFQEDAQKVISGLDVLVAPAVDEAFGRTLVEAMGLGTLVVASGSGGHREIIEHGVTGFLVESDGPEFFAQQVMDLLVDEDLHKNIAHAAAESVEKKFSAQHSVQVFEDIYMRLKG